ncbi:hypothetical protein VD0002_g5602 [Verticillium dahliae]|uniref:Uncharacterized protein n=1 Tax=Verticillium dahliae TaxID=27337 RepID=A0AA44W9B3_VERDA|nr:hypothetical protein BJF96_g10235 [Verticillium dahliae]PNH49992.1 hypothetical protein VD0003_g7153 [Verticillium dahliae]PNH62467.1 hypothetical protein VD0002_g5602 [Verticillium dahliae]
MSDIPESSKNASNASPNPPPNPPPSNSTRVNGGDDSVSGSHKNFDARHLSPVKSSSIDAYKKS